LSFTALHNADNSVSIKRQLNNICSAHQELPNALSALVPCEQER